MHRRMLKTIAPSAEANGWVHRGTLDGWATRTSGGNSLTYYGSPPKSLQAHHWERRMAQAEAPSTCTFWFHLKEDENAIIGFDWYLKRPSEVRTRGGSLPAATLLDFSFVSSHKKLNEFFVDSRDELIQHLEPPKETLLDKIGDKIGAFFS